MEFESSYLLWLVLIIPVFIAGYLWAQRRRGQYAARYASLAFVRQALVNGPGAERHIPPALFLSGLTLMIVAMARPTAVVKIPSASGIVVLTIDTSGSMVADDVKPTRMDAAKAAARLYVQEQPQGIQVAVVSFSDDAAVVQAPTTDHDAAMAAIDRLFPQRGTAIGLGLQTSVDAMLGTSGALGSNTGAFGYPGQSGPTGYGTAPGFAAAPPLNPISPPLPNNSAEPRTIILVTDGENNLGPDPIDVARQVAALGIRIYTVGIGSPQGSIVHVQGQDVPTRLDEDTLKQIAENANGTYYNAMTDADLKSIYATLGNQLVLRAQKTEITALVTGLAAAFSLLGGAISFFRLGRMA